MRGIDLFLTTSLVLLGACSGAVPDLPGAAAPAATGIEKRSRPVPAPRVDPRDEGLEITLGEWAITPESETIRPGRVTFVIRNRGTVPHGFEIELEGDNSGHGSGDLFKAESGLLRPGGSTRMTVELGPAVYKIECLVDGHDDMGMEGLLQVRENAPLVREQSASRPSGVAISDFEFAPPALTVTPGTEVTWRNDDPTDHTVTSTSGEFASDALGSGGSFSFRFSEPGTYPYRCAIHPDMKGKVKVE